MPPIAQVLHNNAFFALKSRRPVALFAAARDTISSFPPATSEGTYEFVKCDATLMKNVETTTRSLFEPLSKINFLVLSHGFFTLIASRNETSEGIDKKLALLYYARWKESILGAGTGGTIDMDDLGLEKGYTALKADLSSTMYADLMMQQFATDNPEIQFTHAFPGLVRTPMMMAKHWALRLLNGLISLATYPFTVTPEVCAEYQLSALFESQSGFTRRGAKGDDIGFTPASIDAVNKLWDHTVEVTRVG
ncbi:hypothetical protein C8J57DRAFT_1278384 [Mycena rebaudengoi]|nr:hypothetical protein C8J57DRAFT_1278384 [Mycena rebaudengoi]